MIILDTPVFPESRPLCLDDKKWFDEAFRRIQPQVSELSFANLFLFRKPHGYMLTCIVKSPVVLGRGYDGLPYFLPPLSGDVHGATDLLLKTGWWLYGADENLLETYRGHNDLEIREDRNNSDYLYLRSDLADLPGNRYHKKKNRVNYFASRHEWTTEIYSDRHRQGCLRLLDEWQRVRGTIESPSLLQEVEAAREGLELADSLGLEGVVVKVSGEVKAFALGERLNNDTSVCHFQKADLFLEGLYQLVDREFNRLLFTDCTYVNREQDLGEPNLRKAKLSYHPVRLVTKYRIRKAIRNF